MTQQDYIYSPTEPTENDTPDKALIAQLSMSSRTALRREVFGRARRNERIERDDARTSADDAVMAAFHMVRSLLRRDRTAMTH